jgi:hypothetical protein
MDRLEVFHFHADHCKKASPLRSGHLEALQGSLDTKSPPQVLMNECRDGYKTNPYSNSK